MSAWRHFMGVAVLVLWAPWLAAEEAAREHIRTERQRIEAAFAAQQAACAGRFAVTDCVERARAQRRQALAPLRERELALEADDRQRRAQARREAIRAKQESAASATLAASAPVPSQRLRAPSTPPSTALPSSAPDSNPDQAKAAAARVQEAARRHEQARAAKDRVARREAERAQSGKKVQPLPVPAPASGPGQAAIR